MNKRPKKDFDAIAQVGHSALQLATKYPAQLAPRLTGSLLGDLAVDVNALGTTAVPHAVSTHLDSKSATKTRNGELNKGYTLITATRKAVVQAGASIAVRHLYGVGVKISKRSVKQVLSGLQRIVDRATAAPAEATSLGILPQDVAQRQAAITAITAADHAKGTAQAAAPMSTKERNATGQRILAAVALIQGAGIMAFAASPTERSEFEALLPRKGKKNP